MTKNQGPILTLNAGSSSLKFAVFNNSEAGGEPVEIVSGQICAIGPDACFTCRIKGKAGKNATDFENKPVATHKAALERVLDYLETRQLALSDFAGVGHRIVHGGTKFTSAVRVDKQILSALKKLAPLAPHHMPHNLEAIRSLAKIAPDLPQIACFDTAFHATQPEIETRLALPKKWFERGIRRYGFHGLNYEHVVKALPRQTGASLPSRLIILHLGNGASICAVKDGVCVGTTMGFSTIDGLVMGTRSGAIDPGVLLHLQKNEGLDVAQLEDLLYNRSGLLGLSGISGNMRDLVANGAPEARFAVDKYAHAAARHTGSLIPLLGGLDAIVFTGGIGENAVPVRAKIAENLACFGVRLDRAANAANQTSLTTSGSQVGIWIIPANEEGTIAEQVFSLIRAS